MSEKHNGDNSGKSKNPYSLNKGTNGHKNGHNGCHDKIRFCIVTEENKLIQTEKGENRFSFHVAKAIASEMANLLKMEMFVVPKIKIRTMKLDPSIQEIITPQPDTGKSNTTNNSGDEDVCDDSY